MSESGQTVGIRPTVTSAKEEITIGGRPVTLDCLCFNGVPTYWGCGWLPLRMDRDDALRDIGQTTAPDFEWTTRRG